MKYRYEIELYGEIPNGGSMITFLSNLELFLHKNETQLVYELGNVIFDTNGETIISFGRDLYYGK